MNRICSCGRSVTVPGKSTCSAVHLNPRTGWRWDIKDKSVYMNRFQRAKYWFKWRLKRKREFLNSLEK